MITTDVQRHNLEQAFANVPKLKIDAFTSQFRIFIEQLENAEKLEEYKEWLRLNALEINNKINNYSTNERSK